MNQQMLLHVSGIRKLYSADIVLDGVDFRIDRKEKVALVGRNGSGKTTLLKILVGEEQPDSGVVQLSSGAKVGYLSQHAPRRKGMTVLEVALEARQEVAHLVSRLSELEAKADDGFSEDELEEFASLQEHLHGAGAYSMESDLKVVLKRLGFEESSFEKQVDKLSGGEKTRLALAKLLLEEPDLMILDEPTNHLDIEAIEWLESWVKQYGGAVLTVSHDRTFLNATSQRVLELRNGQVKSFPGPFDRYVELAREEDERLADVAAKQQDQMAKLDEYVRRFMNSQRTAQARGRLKQLEKLKSEQVQVAQKDRDMSGMFQVEKRAGDQVLVCKGLTKAYGERTLFQGVDWIVQWGEKWALVGPNGAGKSTLAKVALGKIEADEGVSKLGSSVDLGWFAQDLEFLDLNDSPLDAVCGYTGLEPAPARNLLGRFLVSGDDVFRPLKTMSGGERVKVALACLMGDQPNVLILDEPSNHLDLSSSEALASILREFNGTLVLISHDRWLLDQVCHQLLEIKDGKHTEFPGTLSEFRAKQKLPEVKPSSKQKSSTTELPSSLPSQREISKLIGKLQKDLDSLESEVAAQESKLEALERKMSQPKPEDDVYAMSLEHGDLQAQIESAYNQWTEVGTELEKWRNLQGQAPEVGVSFREKDS